jgi:hypothetical protein
MVYIPLSDDFDPGMRYEGLARYAFDCQRWEGPNNIAHQGAYNSLFIPETNEEGLLVINQILDALILKEEKNKVVELTQIKNSLTERMKQETAIDLFDYVINILQN